MHCTVRTVRTIRAVCAVCAIFEYVQYVLYSMFSLYNMYVCTQYLSPRTLPSKLATVGHRFGRQSGQDERSVQI